MVVDKHSQDAMAKLYAEWVSAGVKLSVAGFAATTKIMEAATQSIVSSRAKSHVSETPKAEPAPADVKPDTKAATPTPLTIVPKQAKPVEAEPARAVPEKAEAANVAVADDLKLISGIGPKLEQILVRNGVTTFAQIAALSSDAVVKLDAELNLNGRILRDDWMGQAAKLAGNVGGQTWQN
jgi:NADH-quinone oxidoreductase subunit E